VQVVQHLRGVECSGAEKSAAWKAVMRQLNEKVAATGTLFSGKKGAGAEAARLYSFKAYSALSPAEQAEHSWSCSACAQSMTAQKIFGSAVLREYASGAPRGDGPRRAACCVSVSPGTLGPALPSVMILVVMCYTFLLLHSVPTPPPLPSLRRWRGLPQGQEAQRRGWS